MVNLVCKILRHRSRLAIYPGAFFPTYLTPPEAFRLLPQFVPLRCPDGVTVMGCMVIQPAPSTRNRPTVFIFHGNGGNYCSELPIAQHFFDKLRCNIFMLSYRGYIQSGGTRVKRVAYSRAPLAVFFDFNPSVAGIRLDAQTALDFILKHELLSQTKLILYGQSLGGAVAIDLASRNPDKVTALILENTFLSIPKMIRAVLPVLAPYSLVCAEKWNSEKAIALVPRATPMLFLSGLCDQVVPSAHMRRLFEVATHHESTAAGQREHGESSGGDTAEPRVFRSFALGRHNDTSLSPDYWTEIEQFFQRLALD